MILHEPSSLHQDPKEAAAFKSFLQQVVNRKLVGGVRYGAIQKRQRYMSRLRKELEVYLAEGNHEQLLNIAVYAFLESFAPENKKFHHNAFADSATRKTFGV